MGENRETWITGIGIVSCLGEGPDAHWQALMTTRPAADTTTFAPFVLHSAVPVDFDKQIPKKSDQRQMEPWQRIGTYAAGLALDSAGVKGDRELLSRMDMIVGAAGGERDIAVDNTIMNGLLDAADPDAFLNERLMNDLRPTLFLAQLPNLLAGNISIVHGVTGSSRTFMGEETAGIDAARIAWSRIATGQSEIALVGAAYHAARKDLALLFETGHYMLKDGFAPVWERDGNPGFALGSMGAFLVFESRSHAEARGAKPLARLTKVAADRGKRDPGGIAVTLNRLMADIAPRLTPSQHVFMSGATGAAPATREEREFLSSRPGAAIRATGSWVGHGMDAQFPMNLAIATIAVHNGALFPPADATGTEQPMPGPLKQAVVTGVGHWRGEGIALIEAV